MGEGARPEMGSIIVVVATDAPLLPHQLKRLAKRVSLGIGRMGGIGGDSSGDIFIAFSTANPGASADTAVTVWMWPNDGINGLFEATIDATEEAIVNAMVAAETMTGADGYRVHALPTGQVVTLLKRAGRIK
jgi:L-aminopeptidase/D-esterase-like protein